MNAVWYCTDCERRIARDEIENHEARDHHVRGQLRPERLLGNDPNNVTVLLDTDADDESGTVTTDREVSD